MKIKVTYEEIYDSHDFYAFDDEEDLSDLTFEQFSEGLRDTFNNYPEDIIDFLKFEKINDNI